MVSWKDFDSLSSYETLQSLKNHVDVKKELSGENGAERVRK